MQRQIIRNLFALGLILLLTACASNIMHRSNYDVCTYTATR